MTRRRGPTLWPDPRVCSCGAVWRAPYVHCGSNGCGVFLPMERPCHKLFHNQAAATAHVRMEQREEIAGSVLVCLPVLGAPDWWAYLHPDTGAAVWRCGPRPEARTYGAGPSIDQLLHPKRVRHRRARSG